MSLRPTRRSFLAAAAIVSQIAKGAGYRPIRLGRPIFLKSEDLNELAKEHRPLGYAAAYCQDVALSRIGRQ